MIHTKGRKCAVAALLAAAVGLAGAESARAAAFPAVAVQPDGTASIAFKSGEQGSANKIGMRRWPFGAALAAAQFVSAAGGNEPEIAVNAAGQTAVVWSRGVGNFIEIEARRREADGTLGPVLDLTPAGTSGTEPQVAIAPDGSALFVYYRFHPSSAIVARRLSADGVLGPVKVLSALGFNVGDPAVAMDGAGNGVVTWYRRNVETEEYVAQARRVAADGTAGVVKTLAPAAFGVKDTTVGIDNAGRAVIAWLQHDGIAYLPRVIVRGANGTYSPVEPILNSSPAAEELRLSVNGAGVATLAWLRTSGAAKVVEMRRRAADGTLSETVTMSPAADDGVAKEPEVATTPQGGSYVVWQYDDDSQGAAIQGRRRSSAGVLGSIQQLSADGQFAYDPDVAVDGNGNATVAWSSSPIGQAVYTVYARRHSVGYAPAAIKPISG